MLEGNKTPLLGMTLDELRKAATEVGLPAFTGSQLADWIYRHQADSMEEMTNISKKSLSKLQERFTLGKMPHSLAQRSKDGTVKYLFPTLDGQRVESVYIPDGDRGTLCVSCQVGCRMGCRFCMTGRQGFQGNLTAKDNVIYQAKLCGCDEKNALQLLDTVGLADAGGKKVKNFSLGMKQRLGIAIAMLNNPDFLILDEPTNGLDPQGIVDLRAFLEKLVSERGITLLISSHILSELSQLATYYIFISHGKIIQTITAKALQASLGSTVRIKTTSKEASETFTKLTVDSMIKGYIQDGDEYVLRDPADYNSVIKALSTLDVKSLETENETLETYYLHLKGGRA